MADLGVFFVAADADERRRFRTRRRRITKSLPTKDKIQSIRREVILTNGRIAIIGDDRNPYIQRNPTIAHRGGVANLGRVP